MRMKDFFFLFVPFVWILVLAHFVTFSVHTIFTERKPSLSDCRYADSLIIYVTCRSSKSALHGLIHWLSQVYGPKGITVNGVAPALIRDTKMLPGNPEELAKSRCWDECILRQARFCVDR